jgi:uncharacterized protein involved in type VI secretion and phage assembly
MAQLRGQSASRGAFESRTCEQSCSEGCALASGELGQREARERECAHGVDASRWRALGFERAQGPEQDFTLRGEPKEGPNRGPRT